MLPTNGFCTKPPKVKLLAGEQKATEFRPSSVLAFAELSSTSDWNRFPLGTKPCGLPGSHVRSLQELPGTGAHVDEILHRRKDHKDHDALVFTGQ